MVRYRITAPVADINGPIAGLRFNGSVAETDDVSKLAYFRRQRYRVEEIDTKGDVEEQLTTPPIGGEDEPKAPAKSAAKPEWVAFAVSRGMLPDEAEKANKDKLIELFAPKEGEGQ